MVYHFPFTRVMQNGKEYIQMKNDVFYQFFWTIIDLTGIQNEPAVQTIRKEYCRIPTYKKKRIRFKKEKQVMIAMAGILYLIAEGKVKASKKQEE